MSREDHYRVLFELAWDGKGLVLDLHRVPTDILKLMILWRNEKVERENEQVKNLQR